MESSERQNGVASQHLGDMLRKNFSQGDELVSAYMSFHQCGFRSIDWSNCWNIRNYHSLSNADFEMDRRLTASRVPKLDLFWNILHMGNHHQTILPLRNRQLKSHRDG